MTVHNFTVKLDESARFVDAPWWRSAYEGAFGQGLTMAAVRKDGWAQRGGVDRVLILPSGKQITADEKVRTKDWPDFALEFFSDRRRKVPGWVACDLACDYIAYAFVPSGRCYLLPFQQLRRAWRDHHAEWVTLYRKPHHVAYNEENGRTWETWFVPVPIPVVLDALTDAMLVRFSGEIEAAA